MERFIGIVGILILLAVAFAMSNNRKAIDYKLIMWGLGLQLAFALFILKTPVGYPFFEFFDAMIKKLLAFSDTGGDFLFASFVSGQVEPPIINFAVRVLPTMRMRIMKRRQRRRLIQLLTAPGRLSEARQTR